MSNSELQYTNAYQTTLEHGPTSFAGWPYIYSLYKNRLPNHRGKRKILAVLQKIVIKQQRPFLWRMKNGSMIAVSPMESLTPEGVAWTCFEQRVWEPHVEAMLRRLLTPGDTAIDVGANIGYFTAVMAQCVGAKGQVFAFEPVPLTYQQLAKGVSANHYSNVNTLQIALGATNDEIDIGYNPSFLGDASFYSRKSFRGNQCLTTVDVRRLDDLVDTGKVASPSLIKIDVEGYELSVIKGAEKTLTSTRPYIITEFNSDTAALAHWTLADMSTLLKSYGYRFFYMLTKQGTAMSVDLESYSVANGEYIDILASPEPVLSIT